tara:strand:+ start:875 stop:1753 length:879 start_codon:yes stop_codon:yes gene_type:complete
MPIGAAIGVGVLGAGASVVGASKNSKAIKASTQAQSDSNAASVALQREVYGNNEAALSPFMSRGNAAGDQLNDLLGLGGQPAQQQQQPNLTNYFSGANPGANPRGGQSAFSGIGSFGGLGSFSGQYPAWQDWAQQQRTDQQFGQPAQQAQPAQTAQGAQNNAFENFRNSTGYQFRLGEGMNALNSGWAGAGTLQSGAAQRAAQEYGQNFASNEFGNYAGLLANQQGVGLSGASALAGVGQNFASNITSLNNQNAQNISNSAVASANNSNAMWGGIGGAASGILGSLSYKGGK